MNPAQTPHDAPRFENEDRRRLPLAPLAGALALGALLLALALARDFGVDGWALPFKGALLTALGLAPACMHALARARGAPLPPFPFLPLIGAIYAVFFGLPLLLSDQVVFMSLEPRVAALDAAADQVLIGLLALYGGWWLIGALHLGSPLRLGGLPAGTFAAALVLLPMGFAARVALRAEVLPAGLVQPVALLGHGALVGLGLLFVLERRGHLSRGWRVALWAGLLPAHMLFEIADGALGYAARDAAFVLMLIWGTGGRVPVLLLAVTAATVLGLRGAASEFRIVLRHSPHLLEESALERGWQYLSIAGEELRRDGVNSVYSHALERFSQIALFAEVVERTPMAVPYWEGATYTTLPAIFVPRALWPDKPPKELGQRFGHRYGILHHSDTTTSINLPQMVEGYVNFGAAGVLFAMLFLGVIYRLLARLLVHRASGDAGLVLGALFASRLLHVESDLSLVLGQVLQLALLFVPLFWLLRARAGVPRRQPVNEPPKRVVAPGPSTPAVEAAR